MDWYRDGENIQQALSQQQNPNRVGPIRKPGLDLLEKDEVKAKRPSMWKIVFYNDDYTPMDFVVKAYPSASGSTKCCSRRG
jgi:ATP-dependent Clp protease adapter protein ClpS